jgi:hypothetical protein
MTQLHVAHCELTYEGAFEMPAFRLVDTPGRLYDLLLEALSPFGCDSSDLGLEEDEPFARGVACDIDELDARVTLLGDRVEIYCANFVTGTAAGVGTMLENVWLGLSGLDARLAAKTHTFLFEADVQVCGSSYRELLNRLAPAPETLPHGTETAVVYYLPADAAKGYGESSLVLNRSDGVDTGLQVNATLVYEAGALKPASLVSNAMARHSELLRNLEFEWIED